MEKRAFPLGVVISVVNGKVLFPMPDGLSEYRTFLNFMAGEGVYDHQIPRVLDECRPYLIGWFPWLGSPEMQFAIGELLEMLKTQTEKEGRNKLLLGWVSKIVSGKYGNHGLTLTGDSGDMLEVEQLPPEAHERIDPHSELAEKMHPDKILTIER
jgi:hypothetical protein